MCNKQDAFIFKDFSNFYIFSPLSDLLFDVFKEIVAELITETVGSYLGFNSTRRTGMFIELKNITKSFFSNIWQHFSFFTWWGGLQKIVRNWIPKMISEKRSRQDKKVSPNGLVWLSYQAGSYKVWWYISLMHFFFQFPQKRDKKKHKIDTTKHSLYGIYVLDMYWISVNWWYILYSNVRKTFCVISPLHKHTVNRLWSKRGGQRPYGYDSWRSTKAHAQEEKRMHMNTFAGPAEKSFQYSREQLPLNRPLHHFLEHPENHLKVTQNLKNCLKNCHKIVPKASKKIFTPKSIIERLESASS